MHRDIKGENILITSAGEPRICDFNLSSIFDAEKDEWYERNGFRIPRKMVDDGVGTPNYVADEIWDATRSHRPYDAFSADVYSFSIVLYMMMNGEFPYNSMSGIDLRQRARSRRKMENEINLQELRERTELHKIILATWKQAAV